MEERLNAMEEYLKNEKQIFIKYEDKIDSTSFCKLQEMMNTYQKTKVKECFERSDIHGITFLVEYPCVICKNTKTERVSKTQLFELLEHKHVQLCDECLDKQREEYKEKTKKIEEINRELAKENEDEFFNEWLNPDYSLTKEAIKNPYNARNDIYNSLWFIDQTKIKDYVNNQMTYKQYLSTPYWQLVSMLAKRKAKYKCQLCGSDENLNTHHRSYKHKGFEIRHMEDLIVLCQDCHSKFHEVV